MLAGRCWRNTRGSRNCRRRTEVMRVLLLPVLNQLFAYNFWARSRQLEVCSTLSKQQFEQPLGNSFTSVRATLVHLMGAEWVWLERLSGRSPEQLPDICDFPTLEAIARRWGLIEDSFRQHLSGL